LLLGMTYALSAVLGFLTIGRLLDPDNILHLATAGANLDSCGNCRRCSLGWVSEAA